MNAKGTTVSDEYDYEVVYLVKNKWLLFSGSTLKKFEIGQLGVLARS